MHRFGGRNELDSQLARLESLCKNSKTIWKRVDENAPVYICARGNTEQVLLIRKWEEPTDGAEPKTKGGNRTKEEM